MKPSQGSKHFAPNSRLGLFLSRAKICFINDHKKGLLYVEYTSMTSSCYYYSLEIIVISSFKTRWMQQ